MQNHARHLSLPKPLLCALLVCLTGTLPAAARIYRCDTEDGSVAFAQFPCKAETEPEMIAIEHLNVVVASSLTPQERQALARLEAQMQKKSQNRSKTNERTRRQSARDRAAQAQSCFRSQQRMNQLRDTRRRGYSLKDSAGLKQELTRLRGEIERDC